MINQQAMRRPTRTTAGPRWRRRGHVGCCIAGADTALLDHLLFQFACHCRWNLTVIKLLSNSIVLKENYFSYIMRRGLSPRSTTFSENDPEYSDTIAERTKIACPVDPPVLKARDLGNNQSELWQHGYG